MATKGVRRRRVWSPSVVGTPLTWRDASAVERMQAPPLPQVPGVRVVAGETVQVQSAGWDDADCLLLSWFDAHDGCLGRALVPANRWGHYVVETDVVARFSWQVHTAGGSSRVTSVNVAGPSET